MNWLRFRLGLLTLCAFFIISSSAQAIGVLYLLHCAGSIITFSWLRAPRYEVALKEMLLSKTDFLNGDVRGAFKRLRDRKFFHPLDVEYRESEGPQPISLHSADTKTLGGFGFQLVVQLGLQTHCVYDSEIRAVVVKLPPDLKALIEGKTHQIDLKNSMHALLVKDSYLSLVEELLHVIEMDYDVTVSPAAAAFFQSSFGKGITGLEAMEADVASWMIENGLISLENPDIRDRAYLAQRYRSRRQLLRYFISIGKIPETLYPELKNYEDQD